MVTVESSLFMVEGCKKYNNDLLIKFDSNFKKNHHLAIMNQNNRKEGDSLQCPSGCPTECPSEKNQSAGNSNIEYDKKG